VVAKRALNNTLYLMCNTSCRFDSCQGSSRQLLFIGSAVTWIARMRGCT